MGMAEGVGHYALLCAEDGGILDDVFIYRLGPERFLVVHNAANASLGLQRIMSAGKELALGIHDVQSTKVMIPVQGPKARNILVKVLGEGPWANLGRHECLETTYTIEGEDYDLFVAQSGYTGIGGSELITQNKPGGILLERLIDEGAVPCGLGVRDTLRLEAALHLHGNDIDASTNPWEAGLGFAVSLKDGVDFTGRDALVAAKKAGLTRRFACLRATDRGVMRAGCPILHGGEAVSRVTSGGFSPMLRTSIGMGYLPLKLTEEGTELQVDVRGKPLSVMVVPRPFYPPKEEN